MVGPGAVRAPDDAEAQVRFALAMNGGVSLAVWIGGVCDELLRLCRAGERLLAIGAFGAPEPDPAWSNYEKVCWAASARPRVDVLAGASAGGLNAVFLSLGLIYGKENLRELRDLWLDAASFGELLRDPLDRAPTSLLMGDDYFLVKLEDAIAHLTSEPPRPPGDVPIRLTLTATSMEGRATGRTNDYGGEVVEREHAVTLRFRHDPDLPSDFPSDFVAAPPLAGEALDNARQRMIKRLARACRSTASFPGAFEPSLVTVATGPLTAADPLDCLAARQADFTGRSFLIDGGTLVNLPVEDALEAVFEQYGTGQVRRIFAMVVPDPSVATAPDGPPGAPPSLLAVVTGALSTIPRNQTVGRFLDELSGRNDDLGLLRETRLALLGQPWGVIEATAVGLFPVYLQSRQAASRVVLGYHLDAVLTSHAGPLSPELVDAWRRSVADIVVPWLPNGWETTTEELRRWGRTSVRRSAARLLHLIAAADKRTPLPGATVVEWRRTVQTAIKAMCSIASPGGSNLFPREHLAGPIEGVAQRLQLVRDRWVTDRDDVGRQLRALGEVMDGLAAAGGLAALDELPQGEGLRLLLALEVIETTFRGFELNVEQSVHTVRIDSLAPSPLDRLGRRRPEGKVAGVQLGHFGSFLKTSWRANDWMWGRLDGSGYLIDIMLRAVDGDRIRRLVEQDEAGDDADVRARLKRLHHSEIVLEETGTLVGAIERDRDDGGSTSRAARSLEEKWASTPPRPANRVQSAEDLLAANRIGDETVAGEAGSDLLSRVSITALAAGASVLKGAGPKVLVAPIWVVRFVALLAWGMSRATFGGPYGRTLAGVAFGLGAGIVAVELYPGTSLGAMAPVGLALFAAGAMLAFMRAGFVLVPLLVFMVFPLGLAQLPVEPWSFWPDGWPFPTLRDRWAFLPSVAFVVGVLVIGGIRRPRWLQERRVAVRHTD